MRAIQKNPQKNKINTLKNYFLAARPKTLVIALAVWWTGWTLSIALWGRMQWALNAVILLCMLFLQTAVNYFNDALDFKRNRDTGERLGPPRMAQSRRIQASSLIRISYFILFLAACLGLYLVMIGGFFIFLIGLTALGMTYFYSAPPIALADRGLSEIFVFLFFGVLAVGGICSLNAPLFDSEIAFFYLSPSFIKEIDIILTAGAQMGLLSTSLLIINHLRDHQEDRRSGKKTWVVRKGRNFGLIQWAFCIIFSYFAGIYWMLESPFFTAGILPLAVLPLHLYILKKITQEKPSEKYNAFLALSSIGQLFFSTALSLGWLIK